MAIGETLLKITDYPFVYSLALFYIRFAGMDPFKDPEALIYLEIAGFAGTLLAILDPFGRLFKAYFIAVEKARFEYYADPNYENKLSFKIFLKLNPKLKEKKSKIKKDWNYIRSAFNTKSIELEKDKLLSIFYFLIIITVVFVALPNYEKFDEVYPKIFVIEICNVDCGKAVILGSLFVIAILIVILLIYNGLKFFKSVETVSTYLLGIGSLFVTKTSTETLSKFIEMGDWETADSWKNIVEEEYVNEEALKVDRKKNQQEHTSEILNTFSKHYEGEKQANLVAMTKLSDYSSESTKNLEEILKSYPLYNEFAEHLCTSKDKELFNHIKEYFVLNDSLKKSNATWMSRLREELDDIVEKNLELKHKSKSKSGYVGENGQWINFDRILDDLLRFLKYERENLLPIVRSEEGSNIWSVRFFDSSTLDNPREDIVSRLYKPDAEKLTVELGNWVKGIRENFTYSQTDYEKIDLLVKKIEKSIKKMNSSYSVMGHPLSGSCPLCRNDSSFEQKIIDEHTNLINEIPSIVKTS